MKTTAMSEEKTEGKQSPAIVMWDNGGMSVMIPKKRSPGYLKTPLYHNYVETIARIEEDESTEACGLDGYLEFRFPYETDATKMQGITKRIMSRLAEHYRFKDWREDKAEFWRIQDHQHPNQRP